MDERAVFSLQARENPPLNPFEHAVAMMIKGRYKMLYFYGFPEFGEENELVEMYDLEKDPEEMNNLYSLDWDIAQQMRQEILDRLAKENEPYS